jgi:hypothetical protein
MSGFLEPLDSQEEAEQLAAALAASVTLQTGVGPAVGPAPEVQTASEASSEDEASDGSADVWVVVSAGASAGSSAAEEPAERPTLRGALAAGEAFVATEESARGLRFYAVWVAPGVDQSIIGVHVSTGSSGWYELIRFLPRGRYSYFDGTRLRRYASFKAAHLAYERESVGSSNFLPGATLRW